MASPSTPKVPEAAVEAVYLSLDGEQLTWLASSPPGRKALVQAALAAAQPHLLSSLLTPEAIEAVDQTINRALTERSECTEFPAVPLRPGRMELAEAAIQAAINAISGGEGQ